MKHALTQMQYRFTVVNETPSTQNRKIGKLSNAGDAYGPHPIILMILSYFLFEEKKPLASNIA